MRENRLRTMWQNAGKTVVDMSSISPIETKASAKRTNELGCDYGGSPWDAGRARTAPARFLI